MIKKALQLRFLLMSQADRMAGQVAGTVDISVDSGGTPVDIHVENRPACRLGSEQGTNHDPA
jgi:hypothetical protein